MLRMGELFFVVGEREIHSFNGMVGLMENGDLNKDLKAKALKTGR